MNFLLPTRPLRSPSRSGFALALTIVLVLLVALAMTSAARLSVERGRAARSAAADLQTKWGTLTIEQALLPRAEAVLHREEVRRRSPVATTIIEIALGSSRFQIVIADEQAKANVNAMLRLFGRQQTELLLRELVASSAIDASRVQVPRSNRADLHVSSLTDVFREGWPVKVMGGRIGERPLDRVTCWGDGRMNIRRTSADVLASLLRPMLNRQQIDRIVELQTAEPERSIEWMLSQLDLSRDDLTRVENLVTDGSRAYSIAIQPRNSPHGRLTITRPAAGRFDRPFDCVEW